LEYRVKQTVERKLAAAGSEPPRCGGTRGY